ncbi:MAG: RluA family pseudouridine synthase [Candidatus Puniceispirillaceae bacterium]
MVIGDADKDSRLDRFLRRKLGRISQSHLEKALRSGQIRINGEKKKSNYRLVAGDELAIADQAYGLFVADTEEKPANQSISAETASEALAKMELARSDDWIAYNKPSGLAVQGGSKTSIHLDGYLQAASGIRAKLVHRIDKDTSGLVIVARHDGAARHLATAFKEHLIRKSYLALVSGTPELSGTISAPLQKQGIQDKQKMVVDEAGLPSITHFRRLASLDGISLVALQPVTGRTHQLRAHMAYINAPILGDGKYGGRQAHIAGFAKQLHLHAHFIRLVNEQILTAPLPAHMKDSIDRLGLMTAIPDNMPIFEDNAE